MCCRISASVKCFNVINTSRESKFNAKSQPKGHHLSIKSKKKYFNQNNIMKIIPFPFLSKQSHQLKIIHWCDCFRLTSISANANFEHSVNIKNVVCGIYSLFYILLEQN